MNICHIQVCKTAQNLGPLSVLLSPSFYLYFLSVKPTVSPWPWGHDQRLRAISLSRGVDTSCSSSIVGIGLGEATFAAGTAKNVIFYACTCLYIATAKGMEK